MSNKRNGNINKTKRKQDKEGKGKRNKVALKTMTGNRETGKRDKER